MNPIAIELNDAGIEVAGAMAVGSSPGYAVVEGAQIHVGKEALGRARLLPRMTFTRFWQDLDTTPLPRPFPQSLSTADLVHAHLSAIWENLSAPESRNVVLAVPGIYSERQLGLLVGIARACGMTITGMVESAVAASSLEREGDGEFFVHLDLHLHRVVATKLIRSREPRVVERDRSEQVDQGRVELWERWAKAIAEKFVRETRFDPLHAAATEQALFEALPGLLESLASEPRTRLVIPAGSKEHEVELHRDELAAASAGLIESIVTLLQSLGVDGADRRMRILLSHRLAALPSLETRLKDLAPAPIVLAPAAAARGALNERSRVEVSTGEDSGLSFVTRLSWNGAAEPEASDRSGAGPSSLEGRGMGARPTHLLYHGIAHPIDKSSLWLGTTIPEEERGIQLSGRTSGISRRHCRVFREADQVVVEDVSRHGSFVNGERISGRAPLYRGDRLRLGSPGIDLQLIEVVEGSS